MRSGVVGRASAPEARFLTVRHRSERPVRRGPVPYERGER